MSGSSTPSHASSPRAPQVDGTDTARHTDEAPKPSWKEDALGDGRRGEVKNVSWGAIIAGTVTFLALTILLSLITAALGLGMADLTSGNPGEGVGVATGISSVVTLVLALAAGGYVAGALAGRAGLIHGFLTWATSLLTAVVLAGLLVGNILGAAGNVLGSTAQTIGQAAGQNPEQVQQNAPDVSAEEAQDQASQAAEDAEQSAQEAAPEAEQAADTAAAGSLWTFAGLLIGAIVAAIAGLLGSRSVSRDRTEGRVTRSSRA